MGSVKLTEQQELAVRNSGGQLLVSAAAGSGKTKVIVERLMDRLNEGRHIDDFLMITYTKAAAAELRGKIMDALYERIAEVPDSRRYRSEIDRCGRAKIGTIHSFCSNLIRENASLVGLSPDFRACDETESKILKRDTMRDLLDQLYDEAEPGFMELADTMGSGKDDSALEDIILETHEKLLSHPSPEKWAMKQLEMLDGLDRVEDAFETVWGQKICQRTRGTANYWIGKLEALLSEAAVAPDFIKAYGDSIGITLNSLKSFRKALDVSWNMAVETAAIEFPKAGRVSGYDDLKSVRTKCRDSVKKFTDVFHDSSQKVMEDLRASSPAVEALFKTVLRFDREYSARKRRNNLIDFSDQEHIALQLLVDSESGEPTETARTVSERFYEIMIDEYQDVNEIQELIFSAVSKDGKNIFMVGDVKQSIYRFRLADPRIFLRKYRSFKDAEEADEGEPRKIILSKNFRSRPQILDAVNFIFKNVMSREFGEIDYSEREYLYPGAQFPETIEAPVELDILDMSGNDNWRDADRAQVEAEFVINRLKELVESATIPDGAGGTRNVRYGDIAILMRSPKSRMPIWAAQFTKAGIPLQMDMDTDFFNGAEISIIMSLLAVIDNPHQDIPLIAVLRSPIYMFTPDELVEIRMSSKNGDFYSALVSRAEDSDKCRHFLEELDSFRSKAPEMPADRFIWYIFRHTGMLAIAGAMPGGERRKDNLLTLFQTAQQLEEAGYKGLFAFINYIGEMRDRGESPVKKSKEMHSDAVTITSIHSSKGLEYPIVILADLAKNFNKEDLGRPLLIHPELGAGPLRTDLIKRLSWPTIARSAIREQLLEESLAEELRVLYVAMTRAKEKLIMLATYKNAMPELLKLSNTDMPVPPKKMEEGRSAADWILMAALNRPECKAVMDGTGETRGEYCWHVRLVKGIEHAEKQENSICHTEEEHSGYLFEDLVERLDYTYPYMAATKLPSKITATELKGSFIHQEAAEDAENLQELKIVRDPRRPDFMDGVRGLTAAQKGTATHIVMQYADYEKCCTVGGVQGEIDRLCSMGIISEEQAEAVSPWVISKFFNSSTGRLVLQSEKVWREFKFSILVDSGDLNFQPGEDILLQGVVDCCVETEGKLTVIDFKTDYVSDDNVKEKIELYSGQLATYALAMERILEKPVEKRLIVFVNAGVTAEV